MLRRMSDLPPYAATKTQLSALWYIADAGKTWILFRYAETCGPNAERSSRKRQRMKAQRELAECCAALRKLPPPESREDAVDPDRIAIDDPFVASREELAQLWLVVGSTERLLEKTAHYDKTGEGKPEVNRRLMELCRQHDVLLALKPLRDRAKYETAAP
jgi:hypothetical protein